MFTKHIFIDDAIAAFKPYSGIAGHLGSAICRMATTTWNPLKKESYCLSD
jgi:hypothetical protein